MSTRRRGKVAVTGMGLISALGKSWRDCWQALLEGRGGAAPWPDQDPAAPPWAVAARVRGFQPEQWLDRKSARRLEPFAQYAVAAARQAWQEAGLTPGDPHGQRAGCLLAVCLSSFKTIEENYHLRHSPHLSPLIVPRLLGSSAPGKISEELGLLGPNLCLTSVGAGGLEALGLAARVIERGQADLILAGGAETPLTPVVMAGLAAMGLLSSRCSDPAGACRPFDAERDGLVPGEGAAVLALELEEAAAERGAAVLARVSGFASCCDNAGLGQGLARSQALAIEDAELAPEDIDLVMAAASGLPQGDRSEALALRQVFPGPDRPLVTSVKPQLGHWLGAAGAAEALLAVAALLEQTAPPLLNLIRAQPDLGLCLAPPRAREAALTHVLINAAGLAGECASLVLSRAQAAPPRETSRPIAR